MIMSCAAQSSRTQKSKDEHICFGSGGGFAGLSKDFRLSANGKLERKQGIDAPWVQIGVIKQNTTTQLFKQIDNLGLKTLDHNHPGNKYYYIEVPGDTKNKVSWGLTEHEPPDGIKTFHSILMKLTSKKNLSK